MMPPKIEKPNHWEPLRLPFKIGSGRDFAKAQADRIGLRMSFFKNTKGESPFNLEGKVWFGNGIEGPPLHVHGGVLTYVLDEAMGSVCWLNNYACVARNLTCNFDKMTPIDCDHDVSASIVSVKGREVSAKAKIYSKINNMIYASTEGTFYRLPRETIEKFRAQEASTFNFDQLDYSGIS